MMSSSSILSVCAAALLTAALRVSAQGEVVTVSNVAVRVMASNITGNSQIYGAPQIRILQGLKPDIVALQEFNYSNNSTPALRTFVDTAFGPEFAYFREPGSYSIPNGIVSRWPIVDSGSWEDADPGVNDRGFAWARIRLPGTNDLYVVSVHLKASSGTANAIRRADEALAVRSNIVALFPANAWVIVAGDFNAESRTEAAITNFHGLLSDSPVPADQAADYDTNLGRNKPYDYVLPSLSLSGRLTAVKMASHDFPNGLVFDSRLYSPLTDASPVQLNDVTNSQHMAVLKQFAIPVLLTNYLPAITANPTPCTAAQGSSAAFSLTVTGTPPLSIQWRRSGVPIAGATASTFTLSNAQPADQASYSAVVTNLFGSATSAPASFSLAVPPPRLALPEPGVLRWLGLSNLPYHVEFRTNLAAGSWMSFGTAQSASTNVSFALPPSTDATRFLRVVYP